MIASEIGFEELVSYLSRSGWQRAASGRLAELWESSQHAGISVMVPKESGAPDFERSLMLLTKEIARKENRPPEDIARDISRQFVDVTDLRAEDDDIADGTIALNAGVQLFESANRLIVSAAAATINRQGSYGRGMPPAARAHARRMRLGQTRQGSYIVPIISRARFSDPVDRISLEPQLRLESDDSYHDRRIVTTLSHALETLAEMAVNRERSPSRDEMRSSVDEGVSSELCGAVLNVLFKGGVSQFDVKFNWAPAAPVPDDAADSIVFTDDSIRILGEVEAELKEANLPSERVLYGVIRRLSLKANETSGKVAMETAIDGRKRTVTFDLDLETYRLAAHYHGERRPVVVRGILDAPPGRNATMKVSAFDADRSVISFEEMDTV
ncbi:hypothetical protein GCM10009579_74190 [Streptomyces javensis]|uniref:Uncharacterized protein n=2 Tax=Streptomyces javensis TaxID=114698 RepID=A0ABN1XAT1_9ACTN